MEREQRPCITASLCGVFPNTGENVTTQLQKAVDTAAQAGACLVLEEGIYQCGTLYLRSHMHLCIPPGCVLTGSGDISDYGIDTGENRYKGEEWLDRCFLYGEDCVDIRLYGGGEINGNARAFHNEDDWTISRPMMMRLCRCRDVMIEDLRLMDPASWTVAFLECENIMAKRLTCRALINLNGDGLDFDGCRRVLIEDCTFLQSDDCICLTCHHQKTPMEEVEIRRCRFSSWTVGIRIGANSAGDIRNIWIHHCVFEHIWREGIKIESSEGGVLEKMRFENLFMFNVRRPLYYLCNNAVLTKGLAKVPPFGKVAHIKAAHIQIIDTPEMSQTHFYTYKHWKCVQGEPKYGGIRCDAPSQSPMEDILFLDIKYLALGGIKKNEIPAEWPQIPDARTESAAGGVDNYYPNWSRAVFLDCRNIQGLSIQKMKLQCRLPDEREPVILENCELSCRPDWYVSPEQTDKL